MSRKKGCTREPRAVVTRVVKTSVGLICSRPARLNWLLMVLAVQLMCAASFAQATTATASRAADLQFGGGFVMAAPDYGPRIAGYKLYGTYDFRSHYGVEAQFNQVSSHTGDQVYERTYEIGVRYVRHYGNFNPYARLMYGRGVFNFPLDIANLAYNMGVIGGGVDYNLRTHINVRVDYEYQQWIGFPPNGLAPQLGSVGVAYHF